MMAISAKMEINQPISRGIFLGAAWVKHGTWMNIRNRGEIALCAMGLHPAQMGQGGASLSLRKGRAVLPHLPGPPLLLLADSIATYAR